MIFKKTEKYNLTLRQKNKQGKYEFTNNQIILKNKLFTCIQNGCILFLN